MVSNRKTIYGVFLLMNDNNTPNTPDEMVDVIRHREKGGKIEARALLIGSAFLGYWEDASNIPFDFSTLKYRKKPEPLKLWTNVKKTGEVYSHKSKEKAKSYEPWSEQYSRIAVEMVEVIE